jgi:hypothetical protein
MGEACAWRNVGAPSMSPDRPRLDAPPPPTPQSRAGGQMRHLAYYYILDGDVFQASSLHAIIAARMRRVLQHVKTGFALVQVGRQRRRLTTPPLSKGCLDTTAAPAMGYRGDMLHERGRTPHPCCHGGDGARGRMAGRTPRRCCCSKHHAPMPVLVLPAPAPRRRTWHRCGAWLASRRSARHQRQSRCAAPRGHSAAEGSKPPPVAMPCAGVAARASHPLPPPLARRWLPKPASRCPCRAWTRPRRLSAGTGRMPSS